MKMTQSGKNTDILRATLILSKFTLELMHN